MLTELEILNSMLAASGTAPVTSPDSTHPTYIKAKAKLNEVMTSVQKLGLWFNTSVRTLSANAAGEVVLPGDCINCDSTDINRNYVKRGSRVFDMNNHSFTIGESVELKLVYRLPLEDIPESARDFIKDKAKYEFYLDEDGTEPKLSRYAQSAQISWIECYREHLRCRDTNYFKGNNAVRYMKRGRGGFRLAPYE